MNYDVEIPRYCDVPNPFTLLQVHPNAGQKYSMVKIKREFRVIVFYH